MRHDESSCKPLMPLRPKPVAPPVPTALGTTFGGVLFGAADLVAVPAFRLSPPENNKLTPALVSPFAAHLVYGAATELVRRLVRAIV
jgi:putative membrane protein